MVGASATQYDATHLNGFDGYGIGLEDQNAVFDQGSGRQLAHTFIRGSSDNGTWYWNVGRVPARYVCRHQSEAWRAGLRRTSLPGYLSVAEVGLGDAVSGDGDPNDPKLGTLNPLFPPAVFRSCR